MNFKLRKLKVKNFKVFNEFEFNFSSSKLSVLDGPNGFGKTSFFDALELLFLGRVQRYIDLEQQTTYGRRTGKPFPLLYDRAEKNDELIVELIVELDSGEFVTLKRSATSSSLLNLKLLNDATFQLEVFKDGKNISFNDEIKVLTRLLGKNYQNNYHLFHYLEQEENIALLKNRDTDKHAKMDHLFDVTAVRKKINNISQLRTALRPLRTDKKRRELDILAKELKKLKNNLSQNSIEQVDYFRLVNSSNQPWDQENIQFSSGSYAHWLGNNGELNSIAELKKSEVDFLNNIYNESIKIELSLSPKAIEPLLRFGRFIEQVPNFRKEIKQFESAQSYLNLIEGDHIEIIVSGKSVPDESIRLFLGEEVNFALMIDKANEIKSINADSNKLTQSLNNLIEKRRTYLSEFKKYQSLHSKQDTSCPTCGYDWKEFELLKKQFEVQAQGLSALVDGQSAILFEKLKSFKQEYTSKISNECLKFIEALKPSIEFKKEICGLSEEKLHFLNNLKKKYSENKIDLGNLYLPSYSMNEELKTPQLIGLVSSKYKPVNGDVLKPEFKDLFQAIFNESVEALKTISLEDIERKKNYLKQKYAESRLKEFNQKKKDYVSQKSRFDEVNRLETKLRNLNNIYENTVEEYISSVSKGIEILFHIYSGRLLQNFHNGLGVFIESDGRSVSFKDTPQSKHDVVFTMSSGQLSSLIIAFTLALNHKYAKNNLLLIDDPVQTMDEINVAGFIDILRREFTDRQIFISTHEDHTSSYFRYKFKKAGLDQERINLYEQSKQLKNDNQ